MTEADSLIVEQGNGVANLRLNRPGALNALDPAMITGIARHLESWRSDPAVSMVLVEGEGGRAFCAGGDVRAARRMLLDGDAAGVNAFLAEEYRMNGAIAALPKPWVSLIDGVCMGGGIGVSVHGSHRVATEAAVFAMPETTIGLFPDVGTSFVLSRMPGALGVWLGLTGARLQGEAAVEAGFATHFIARQDLPALRGALLAGDAGAIDRMARRAGPGALAALRPAIDRCFGAGSVAAILAALRAENSDWAREQLSVLDRVSPTSLLVTHEMLRRARDLDLPACLAMDTALARGMTAHPDFAEGVRALLVDKDNAPRWTPPTLAEAEAVGVARFFG